MEPVRALPNSATSATGAATTHLAGLGNRFVALFPRHLSREAFAVEIARLVLPALHAVAVAVLGYESRRDRLILLASEGLNDEARAALGNGSDCPWDIPIRGLRNRRISVIAGAHQNPFVPKPLTTVAARGLSIATLPIYNDHEPAGMLLVFAAGSRAFADSQLQTLSQALRVCAPGIREPENSLRSSNPAPQPENVEATIAKLIAGGAIIDPAAASAALQTPDTLATAALAAATPAAQQLMDDLVARVQAFERELTKAQEDLESSGRRIRQLTMNNNALGRERDGLLQRLADFESGHGSEVTELRAELNAAQERLLAVEGERARLHRLADGRHNAAQQAIASLEQERETLQNRAQGAEANVAELQTLLAAVFDERDRLTAQVETLTVDFRTAQDSLRRGHSEAAQERSALEADRDGWKEEAETVRAQLTQRAEQLAGIERELRSTTVGRDALAEQLNATRAELDRTSTAGEELTRSTSQLEAARAALAAENATLRKSFDNERAARLAAENDLRSELTAAQASVERLNTSGDALRAELTERQRALAERDEQVEQLRALQDAARQSDASWQESHVALRAELTTAQARLEQSTTERQQLIEERAALRSALTDLRHRSGQSDVAHAATLGQLQAEVAELRRQTQTLSGERAALNDRVQRGVEESRDLTRRLAHTQRRADELAELARSRDATLAEGVVERERLGAQLISLNGQLRAAQEGLERSLARATQERNTFEAQRAGWEEQSAAVQVELTQRTESLVALERELRSTAVARDAAASELQATQEDRGRLATLADSLRQSLTQTEADRDAAAAGQVATRRSLQTERAARADGERALRADLTAARTEVERLNAAVSVLRNDVDDRTSLLGEREEQLAGLQRDMEALRQQSADRGVLARQATELGQQLVGLQQQLAAVRGEAARAERQTAAVSEELESARRQQNEAVATLAHERTAWHDEQQQLLDQRRRLEGDAAMLRGELDAQRAGLAEDESRRAALAEQAAQLEAAVRAVEERRKAMQQELAHAHLEIEALRQQSVDRGVLANQASDLGSKVVELEQQLAAVRGEAAQAERQRAVVAEELEAARRLQAQTEVVADRKLATLRDAVDRLTEDRKRVEALHAERSAESEAQRTTLAELQASVEQLRSQRADAEGQGHDLAQQLGDAHRRLEDLSGQMHQREAALDAASTDRSRLSAQVAKLSSQLRATQEALDELQGRNAFERGTIEADRDRWREQYNATRVELETLLASTEAVSEDASQAAAARAAAIAEMEGLQRALEHERAGRQHFEETLRAELVAAREGNERLTADTASLRNQLLERESHIAALLQKSEAAQQTQGESQQATAAARSELAALAARLAEAAAEIETTRAERERIERELSELVATRGDEAQALAQQLHSTRTQLRAMEHDRALAQGALNEHQQRTRDLVGAHAASVSQLQTTTEELRKQIAELNAGRQLLSERLERAEQEARSSAARAEEATREQSTVNERFQHLEQQLAAGETRRSTLDSELSQARMEIETWRARGAESGALADHAGELGKRLTDMEQQLAAVRGEAARADRQRAALADELQATQALRDQLVQAAEGEQGRLREKLQQLTEERKRVEALQAQQQGELETQRAGADELRRVLEETRNERVRLEQEGQDLAHQLGEAHRRLEEMSSQLQQREASIDAATADRRRLEDAVRAAEQTAHLLTAEREADVDSDLILHVREERRSSSLSGPDLGSEAVLVIERSAPLSEALDTLGDADDDMDPVSEPVCVVSAEPARELVILDAGKRGDEAAASLRSAGFEAVLAAPVERSVEELALRHISCVMINLAAGPQAWRTLKALRETPATLNVPILAYLMPPDGQKGFCFGRADFGIWPADPAALIAKLDWLRPKLKRLLAVSADFDGMGKLREPLARANISTSIVLDGKQALEYTTIVAPEAAILHLSPSTTAVARAISGIRSQESTADLPLMLLLDKAPPREDVFFAATVRELLIKGTFHFSNLPAAIARAIA